MTNRSSRLPLLPVSEIVAQLAGRAEALCHELLPAGRREGAEWRCGSVEGEPGKSLGVRLTGAKAGVWSDFASGEGGDLLDLVKAAHGLDTAEAIRWAKSFLGIDEAGVPAPRPRPTLKPQRHDEDAAKRTEYALVIWRASRPAPQTPVESYLQNRSITIPVPPSIRFHPNLKHTRTGLYFEAMVAAVQGSGRRITGVHRTFLLPGGRGKAQVEEPKMTLGTMRDGAVRLGPAGPVLGTAEGIETGLSATQLFEVPVWCSLSASRLDRLWLPPEAVEIHIFADNGAPGHDAAERGAKAYQGQGRRVVVRFPPERFGDWNDALSAEMAA